MQMFAFGLLFLCLGAHSIANVQESTDENKKRLLLTDPDVINQRLVHLESSQQTMLQTITELQSHIQKQDKIIASYQGGGATYVRWGKSHCPNSAELVYAGYAAGQKYYHPGYDNRFGGPANMLCLPKDPELTNASFTRWNIEYQGLLASGHRGEAASSYICVDKDPEYLSAGERYEKGRLLYVVNIQCIPLPCPPYHNNHKVTCVVCSK